MYTGVWRNCRFSAALLLQPRVTADIRPTRFFPRIRVYGKHRAVYLAPPLHGRNLNVTYHLNSTVHISRTLCSAAERRKPSGDDPVAGKPTLEYIRDSLSNIQTSIQDGPRWRGYNIVKIALALAVLTGVGVYMFRDKVRQNVAEEVSNVATRSMADEELVSRANELSKALVNDVLNDDNILNQTKEFSSNLIIDIMADPQNQQKMAQMMKELILSTLSDEDTQREVAVQVSTILFHPEVRAALLTVLRELFRDPRVQQEVADFFKSVLASEAVQEEATQLGKTISSSLLKDDGLQKDAGDMMWGAFKYSFTPTWTSSDKNDG